MIIQTAGSLAAAYGVQKTLPQQRQSSAATTASLADRVTISAAGSQALAADSGVAAASAVEQRLNAIKAKSALERTADDVAYLQKNDARLAEITTKDSKTWTSSEIDYVQKTGGFVNTMSALSDQEKAMYDEMIALGNYAAAEGMNMIALTRYGMSGQITTPDGRSFDPNATEITANTVRRLFSQTIVDDSGHAARQFDALAAYLDQREAGAKA